ncbi:MAG: aromatic amino acid transport family protein [bacterium]|nr:aromatic amino acid transport family protein [bacterium]
MIYNKKFINALAVYVGTIIGVGLFGLPYVGAQSGFLILFFLLIIVAGIAAVVNIFYAEIAATTKGLHRLPGYAQKYLGNWAKPIAFFVKTLAIFGSLLAYLIIGGQFLANLFDGPVYLYTFIFFILGAMLIWKDKKSIGPVELIMLFIFIGAILFLFFSGISEIVFGNLKEIKLNNFFVPYGVVLFSMWGSSIIPEIKEELGGNFKQMKKLIIYGLLICVIIYILFNLLIIGISGQATAKDAISGLEGSLGTWVLDIGYIFGIIATFTSFIALGLTVQKLFWYDYKLPKKIGWFLACFIPLGFFIIGFQDFISIIGLTGAVMLGIDGILVILIYLKLKQKQKSKALTGLKTLGYSIMLLLSLGVVLEIFYFISEL